MSGSRLDPMCEVFRPSRHCHITPSEKHTQDMTPLDWSVWKSWPCHLVRDKIANSEFRTSPPASSIPPPRAPEIQEHNDWDFLASCCQSISVTQLEELASAQGTKKAPTENEINSASSTCSFSLHSLFSQALVSVGVYLYPFCTFPTHLSDPQLDWVLRMGRRFGHLYLICAKTGQALHR